jgi:hypothetical protein
MVYAMGSFGVSFLDGVEIRLELEVSIGDFGMNLAFHLLDGNAVTDDFMVVLDEECE